MIKTYKARVNNNNISYLLLGKHGNQMRYNFTNGNVVTNKYPSITLRNRYAQDLLESSLLFANNTIVLDHEEEEYPGEKAKLEEEKETLEQEKAKAEKVNDSSKNYIKKLLEVGENEKISSDTDIDSVLASARDYYNKLQDKRKQ